MEKQIWIDCGAGADDCLAVLAALSAPELHVVGLSAVTAQNAREDALKSLRGMAAMTGHGDIPCLVGSTEPIIQKSIEFQPPFAASEFESVAAKDETTDITDAIWESAQKHPGLTIVALGPLTNIARMILAHPDVAESLKEIVIAGGTSGRGNVTPRAEYHIWADPDAAHLVMDSGIPVTLMTLETSQVSVSTVEEIRALSNLSVIREALDVCMEKNRKIQGQSVPLQGLAAVINLLEPESFKHHKCRVDIELKSSICRGQTVCDLTGVSGKCANALVAVESDASRYAQTLAGIFKLMNEKLEKERSK